MSTSREVVEPSEEVMRRLGDAINLIGRGEHQEARRLLADLWEHVGQAGDALHRCAVAHHLADVQDDVREALVWDRRALEAADSISDERAAQAGVPGPVTGFYPSLHLNLAEDYRKLGDLSAARRHLDQGQQAARGLGDDSYSAMIRGGLEALATRLGDR